MAHIVLKEMAEQLVEAANARAIVETKIAGGCYTSSTTPTLAQVNTASDNLTDSLNDAKSDMEGSLAAFKTACLIEDE